MDEGLKQLRDAAREMRGAALWSRDASILGVTYVEQLRDAAVGWRDASDEMRYAAMLLIAQLGLTFIEIEIYLQVNLGKARSSGSATDASAFWDLLDPPMRARVVAAGFGFYAAGLRRTQPRFPPAMRYALMERWNDCTHTFVFGFGEMTLTPVDYAAITGLLFTGPVPPLDAREVAELHTRSRLLMRGYWVDRYFLGERVFDTPIAPARWRVPHAPPRHMCLLEGLTREDLEVEYRGFSANDFLSAGDFPSYFASRMQARLPEERKTHRTAAHYRAEAAAEAGGTAAPAGSAGVVLGDVPFPPGMEAVLDPGLGLGSGIIIGADLRQAPPPVQLDPVHTTHVPVQRYQEICQRFGFARSYIDRLYSERHEMDLENGRLRRHRCRQSSAVSRLQAKVERLRTRLEVEGIPLDSSDEDEGGSSSDDGPPSPPPPTVTGPSRRRR
ncbi:hypothetical protein JCGZ_17169 [Jatropha curcas]|uniref:Aminotransferase-like plant mobile domain-containing protein n=1 Tax=Jatropha curcas TaxID=180498 RepID=A0A067KEN6_JATCU|nr:hypothetical protein JCGZ_17169 [Jatropha curcas]